MVSILSNNYKNKSVCVTYLFFYKMNFTQAMLTIVLVTSSVLGKPFLYNPRHALSLEVTSSSIPQQQSNIADLRIPKTQQLSKLREMGGYDQSFFDEGGIGDETSPNQAGPGILQKKIEKILRKLQFFSNFSNNNGNHNDKDDANNGIDHDVSTTTEGEALETTESAMVSIGSTEFEELVQKEEKGIENIRTYTEETTLENMYSAESMRANSTPLTLPRILEAIVNLAHRMLSVATYRST